MRYIATYLASSSWDLDALNITTEAEKESLYVKWNKLYVTREDGTVEEFEPNEYSAVDTQFKYPQEEELED